MQGIPWKKAWATIFWSSILVLAILALLAGRDLRRPAVIAALQQSTLPQHNLRHTQQASLTFLVGTVAAFASIFMPWMPTHYIFFEVFQGLCNKAKSIGAEAEVNFYYIDLVFQCGTPGLACLFAFAHWLGFSLLFASHAGFYPSKSMKVAGLPKPFLAIKILCWALFLLKFFGGLQSYMVLFKSKGTVKPSWTEKEKIRYPGIVIHNIRIVIHSVRLSLTRDIHRQSRIVGPKG